jgi:hypothetical protein
MERFGLTSLDDLPPIEAEIAAQLADAQADVEVSAPDGEHVRDGEHALEEGSVFEEGNAFEDG